ncbi:hypothetical protein BY458DRAFT_494569 [Sporodiniella umbellata]|nr:hypothetical protein BY458DRAFT_494569 [Sporodiniella umbellata]
MSTQSSYQRAHINDLFSTLLNAEAGNTLTPEYSLSPEQRQRPTRPYSEVLKTETVVSPETETLDKWYEDLQQYERNLEGMASASVDPKFKEEVQHVDQWFKYLNPAERTATIYTLLQHSSQVQIRFFVNLLQQMSQRDPLGALLSPPEKVDTQLAGAMAKAELEASQKLMSILPYQTGVHRPPVPNRRAMDRHSFAIGDTEEYDRMLTQPNFLANQNYPKLFESSARPKSVLLDNELASIFNQSWPYTAGLERPKSADVSQWSFQLPSETTPSRDPWPSFVNETQPADPVEPPFTHWRRPHPTRPSVPSTVSEEEKKPSLLMSMLDETTPLFTPPDTFSSPYRLSVPGAKQPPFSTFLPSEQEELHDPVTQKQNTRKSSNSHRAGKEKKNTNDLLDMHILEDVPLWLRSLRLHKYNSIFENMKWQDMLKLDDQALLAKGVAALGARCKLLKVFDQVKAHCEANNIDY